MNQYEIRRSAIANAKQVLANAYVQLHKPERTPRQISRYSRIIEDCQRMIQFHSFCIISKVWE